MNNLFKYVTKMLPLKTITHIFLVNLKLTLFDNLFITTVLCETKTLLNGIRFVVCGITRKYF